MKAALVMVNLDTGENYCHVLHGDNPLESAHSMHAKIKGDFPDCLFAFVADEEAKRRFDTRALNRSIQLADQATSSRSREAHA